MPRKVVERSHVDGAKSLGTLARIVEVLRLLAENATEEVSVSGAAATLGLPRTTTHRLLSMLREHGIVGYNTNTRSYSVGPEYFRLAALVLAKQSVESLAEPIMKRLVAETGETCLLSLYRAHDRKMTYVAQERADHALGYTVEMHQLLGLTWGASGRAMLAELPESEVDLVLEAEQENVSPVTGRPLPRPAEMKRQLESIHRQGYATALSHRIPHAYSVASAIVSASGMLIGSISQTLPEMRLADDTEERLAGPVVEAARELSALLGARRVDSEATAQLIEERE